MTEYRKTAQVRLLTDIGIEYETACDVLTKIDALSQPADAGLARALERIKDSAYRVRDGYNPASRLLYCGQIANAALAAHRASPPPPAAEAVLAQACEPWKFSVGDPPDWGSPLHQVFVAGMLYSEKLLCGVVGVEGYEPGDGSEDFDADASKSLENILTAAKLYDPEDGRWAALTAAPTADAGSGLGGVTREDVSAAFAWAPSWSMELTRLVDGVSTYTLRFQGDPDREFDNTEDLYEHLGQRNAQVRADRVLTLFVGHAHPQPVETLATIRAYAKHMIPSAGEPAASVLCRIVEMAGGDGETR